jgi:DNA polymerase sigma
MGSENSLATTVRNIEGETLIFVGNPPVQFDNSTPSLQYSDTNYMNLWMLYLDFMPYFLPKFEYHEREIQFTGGGESCKMTVDFVIYIFFI